MEYNEALKFIHSLHKFKKDQSFNSIKQVLHNLGNPQDKLKFVHIAGTNGKGSVSAMIAAALISSGKKTGLYISPFVIEFCERIQINNNFISHSDLIRYVLKVKKASFDFGVELSEFEFITCIAFCFYYDNNCDVVVLETGLGGRLDATNVISSPLLSVITHIDIDHSEILGDTVEKIAVEKCGIIKHDTAVVTTENQYRSVKRIISETAEKNNSQLIFNNLSSVSNKRVALNGNSFRYNGIEYKTRLIGRHQFDNAMLAVTALNILGVQQKYILSGLKNAYQPARVEVIGVNPTVILDGSHNENGISALVDTLRELKIERFNSVICMMKDKQVERSLKNILPLSNEVFVTELPDNPRCLSAPQLAEICKKYNKNVRQISVSDVLSVAKSELPTVIFGSLYLSGEIKKYFR